MTTPGEAYAQKMRITYRDLDKLNDNELKELVDALKTVAKYDKSPSNDYLHGFTSDGRVEIVEEYVVSKSKINLSK
ncbi:MAG: hypothetical protein KJ906_02220 [Nanoarchaeota archaeon]|nr:hypothetical protein [Nanoarchaeota archaeon]